MYWVLSLFPVLLHTPPLPARLIFWMLATLAGLRTLTAFGFSCADGYQMLTVLSQICWPFALLL